jgi:hypothetical protein
MRFLISKRVVIQTPKDGKIEVTQVGDAFDCERCSAIVLDKDKHDKWHEAVALGIDNPNIDKILGIANRKGKQ